MKVNNEHIDDEEREPGTIFLISGYYDYESEQWDIDGPAGTGMWVAVLIPEDKEEAFFSAFEYSQMTGEDIDISLYAERSVKQGQPGVVHPSLEERTK